MNLGISFAPLVPAYVVWAAFAVAALITVVLLIARSRGAPLRALALALLVLALANPSLTREDRDPIPSVAAVIVDRVRVRTLAIALSRPNLRARRLPNGSSVFRGSKYVSRKPARLTAKPTAPSCSRL